MALSPAVRVQGKVSHDLTRSLLSALDVYLFRSEDMVQQLTYVAAQFDRIGYESEDQGLTKALNLAKTVHDNTAEVHAKVSAALSELTGTDMYSPDTTNDEVMGALQPLDHAVNECYGQVAENTYFIDGVYEFSNDVAESVARDRNQFHGNDVIDALDYVVELCRIISGDDSGAPTQEIIESLIDGYDGIRSMSVEVN